MSEGNSDALSEYSLEDLEKKLMIDKAAEHFCLGSGLASSFSGLATTKAAIDNIANTGSVTNPLSIIAYISYIISALSLVGTIYFNRLYKNTKEIFDDAKKYKLWNINLIP